MMEQVISGQQVHFQLARFVVVLLAGSFLTEVVLAPLARRASRGDKKAKQSKSNLASLVGLFATFVIALQTANFGNLVTVMGTIAAAATVAIGFGMRDQVSSVVAGIFIHTDNPFVKGDYIRVNDFEGVVQEINLRATILNGRKSEKQVVPNNMLTQNVVKNHTKGSRTRYRLEFKTLVEKAEKAEEVLLKIAEENTEVLEKPVPEVSYGSIEEGKIPLLLEYWVKDSTDVKEVRSQLNKKLKEKAVEEKLVEEKKEE